MQNKQSRNYLLRPFDDFLRAFFLRFVPPWLGTRRLTLMTLLWCGCILACGLCTRTHPYFLFVFGLIIFLQHVTDLLDGAIGRERQSGYILWGFYMDHLLDYCFMSSVFVAQIIYVSLGRATYIIFIWFLLSVMMVHAFLVAAATGTLTTYIKGIGITELRVLAIVLLGITALTSSHFLLISYTVLSVILPVLTVLAIFMQQRRLAITDRSKKAS